jgi:hypothetical protein
MLSRRRCTSLSRAACSPCANNVSNTTTTQKINADLALLSMGCGLLVQLLEAAVLLLQGLPQPDYLRLVTVCQGDTHLFHSMCTVNIAGFVLLLIAMDGKA